MFDGHGGIEVAKFCERNFAKVLQANPNYIARDYQKALETSFLMMDTLLVTPEGRAELMAIHKEFPPAQSPLQRAASLNYVKGNKMLKQMVEEESKQDNVDFSTIGCTANVVLIVPEEDGSSVVYCANAGDSRSVLGVAGKAKALSFDHKPTNPKERQRIVKAGSTVNLEGRIDGNLNLSRAIGDLEYKKRLRLKPEEQAITSFPDVKSVKLTKAHDFLVMGCDGIFEQFSN